MSNELTPQITHRIVWWRELHARVNELDRTDQGPHPPALETMADCALNMAERMERLDGYAAIASTPGNDPELCEKYTRAAADAGVFIRRLRRQHDALLEAKREQERREQERRDEDAVRDQLEHREIKRLKRKVVGLDG